MKNHATKLLFRHAVLLQLAAASPVPLPTATLQEGLRLAGHPTDENDLTTELDYLAEKGLLAATTSELASGLRRYRLSAKGRDYLESQRLI